MSFETRNSEQNVRVASKSLFINDKKNRGNETQDGSRTGSMMKFVKPNVCVIREEKKNYDLSDWEVKYAEECEKRQVERPKVVRNCCGNSPFCYKKSHKHAEDNTLFGEIENKVRQSVWAKRHKKDEAEQAVSMLPFYVKRSSRDEQIEKRNLFVVKHRKQMNDDEFMNGVKSGDLAYLVLAQWRIYYAECINVMMSLDKDKLRIKEDRARQQREATRNNADEVQSINEYASQQLAIMGGVATNRMRVVGLRANNELKNLLQRHGVNRVSLAQQSLFQMMLRNYHKNDEEISKLELIRSELDKYTGEIPRGRFFSEDDEIPEWKPASPLNTTGFLIDLSKENDSEDDGERIELRETTFSRKRKLSAFVHTEKSPTLCYKAVCGSQYSYNSEGCNACTSICLNVAGTLAQSALNCKHVGLTELEYIQRSIAWAELVKSGIESYRQRENQKVEFEHVMELLKKSERSDAIRKYFDYEEHTGSMFQEKFEPTNESERLDQLANPDLETAFEMCEKFAGDRLPYACMITFHSHTIAVSSHRHGWHVFDSLGTTVAGKSVLFSVETRRDAIEVIKHLFNFEQNKKRYDEGNKTASVELDYNISYSMFCIVLKKE